LQSKERIVKTFIEDEMKESYLNYAMSVIVSRALPDVRDGLKPVHRRILYDMNELGLAHEKPFKKSARVVGDVLGKYHPHGDQAVYQALVRMAQDFSMRYPLVQGQGNFGSVDGDSPAAMRYTEVKMHPMSESLLLDIDKETVEFVPNFDDTLKEPSVLPSAFPNLLANGSSGIAVGMATNIPPHNLNELINAVIAVIENPSITIDKIIKIMPGPDFPTGGLIIGKSGIEDAYKTGNGQIKLRANVSIENLTGGKSAVIINEIPYQVNKSRLIMNIADRVKEKRVDGISFIRDESDRDGMRIVIEMKKGMNSKIIMNQLFKLTSLETTYGINMIALDNYKPSLMNIKQMIERYIDHRGEIVTKRTQYDLDKAQKRAHILEGFLKAMDNIDAIISIIRSSRTTKEASKRLIERFSFTKPQSDAILDMRLARLTGLEREKLKKEYDNLLKLISELKEILKSKKNIFKRIIKELKEVSKKFGDKRRTKIVEEEKEVDLKDLIVEEDVVVTISHNGFIKRTPITAFKQQGRGGKGVNSSSLKEDDFIEKMSVASTHAKILFVSNKGKAYVLKVFEIINVGKNSKGQHIRQLLPLKQEEYIAAYVTLKGNEKEKYILFTTKNGLVKKVEVSAFQNVRKSGIIAINLGEGDNVINAMVTDGHNELIIATSMGNALRLKENSIRNMGRNARGVTGIKLRDGDYVCGVTHVAKGAKMLIVTEKGYGKRMKFDNFKSHGRGTKGQVYVKVGKKTGKAVGCLTIKKEDEFVIISNKGMIIKLKTRGVSVMGRTASGVRLTNIKEEDGVAAVARVVQD